MVGRGARRRRTHLHALAVLAALIARRRLHQTTSRVRVVRVGCVVVGAVTQRALAGTCRNAGDGREARGKRAVMMHGARLEAKCELERPADGVGAHRYHPRRYPWERPCLEP